MALSAIDPISQALNRTKTMLFPIDLAKWLRLGFCAFLMGLGGAGGGGSGQQLSNLEPSTTWLEQNLALAGGLFVAFLIFVVLLSLLFGWLKSRGQFMFLDGVIQNRGRIKRPWHEFRREGNSLFVFSLLFSIISLVMLFSVVGVCAWIAWPDIKAEAIGSRSMLALFGGTVVLLPLAVLVVLITMALYNFVVPIMYLRRIPVMAAWRMFGSEHLNNHRRELLLFMLMRFLLGIVSVLLALLVVLLSCFLALIPYVGSVLLLPISSFNRLYSLYFIEQYGPEWKVFPQG